MSFSYKILLPPRFENEQWWWSAKNTLRVKNLLIISIHNFSIQRIGPVLIWSASEFTLVQRSTSKAIILQIFKIVAEVQPSIKIGISICLMEKQWSIHIKGHVSWPCCFSHSEFSRWIRLSVGVWIRELPHQNYHIYFRNYRKPLNLGQNC